MANAAPSTALGDASTPAPRALSPGRRSLELLGNLTMREIRAQYKRTALGRLWSFINPLATIGIFSLVFATIMRIQIQPGVNSGIHIFALFLAAALIPWNFISGGIMSGMNALVANAGLLSKVYFPRWIPVVATVLAMAATFGIELSVLIVVMAIAGGLQVLLFLPILAVLAVLTVAFVAGIALMMSVALVYFRDTQHFMALFMQVWFYLTPIVYPISLIVQKQADLAQDGHDIPLAFIWGLNPAYRFTAAYRSVLYDFQMPSWQDWVGCLAWTLLALGAGVMVFRRFAARLVEEL